MLATDICDYWLIFQFHALFYFIYTVLLLHNFFCFEFSYISITPIYLLLWWNPSYDQRNILPSLIMISFCCYYDFPVTSPILFMLFTNPLFVHIKKITLFPPPYSHHTQLQSPSHYQCYPLKNWWYIHDEKNKWKVVSTQKIVEMGYEASINREITVLRTMTHPGVARLISSFRFRDGAYLVLEYASGGDLYDLLKTNGSLDKWV